MRKISFRFMAAVIAFLLCFSCIPVNAADEPSIAFDELFAIVAIGESYQLKYHTENVTESDVIVWEVDENSKDIISIDQRGVVTGLANGYATVNVSVKDFSTQTYVNVAPHIESIRWAKEEYTVPVGITYSNGELGEPLIIVEPEEAFQRAQMNGTFEVSNSSLASADTYSITGMSEGTGTITVTADGKSASARLTVTPEGNYAASIESDWWSPRAIDCSTYIEPGDIVDIEAVLEPYYGKNDCSDEKVVWTVVDGDKDVIDVKFNGNIATVTGLKSGYGRLKAEITNGYYTYFPVRVAPKVESIRFDESMSYKLPYIRYENFDIFNYLIIEPKEAAYNRQYTVDTDNYSAVFTMGVPGIYRMETNGLGTSTITVTPTDNPDLAVSHVFEVVDPSEAGFPESITVLTDTEITRYLHCRYPSYDSTGRGSLAVEYTPSESLTATSWTSDNEDAVKVSENSLDRQGVASAIINCYNTGTANIKAVNKYNYDLEASFVVNVIDEMPEGLEYSTDINIKAADDEGYTENPESFTMQTGTDYEMTVKLSGEVIPDYSITGKLVESLENIGNVSYMPDFMYSGYGYVSETSRITFTASKAGTETLTIGDRSVELIVEGGAEQPSVVAVSDTEQEICADHTYASLLRIQYSGEVNTDTEWTTSNEDSVMVNGSETVASIYGINAGNAVITAVNKENPDLSVQFNITVKDELPPEDAYSLSVSLLQDGEMVDLPDPLELTVNDKCIFVVSTSSTKGIIPRLSAFYNPVFMNPQLLHVEDADLGSGFGGPGGHVSGEFLVTVCADKAGEETFHIGRSEVKVKVSEGSAEPEKVWFSSESYTINVGSTFVLIPHTEPDGITVTWTNSKPEIVSMDGNLLYGLKVGTTTITATTPGGSEASCTIKVLFTDVPETGKYYSTPVYWAVEKGITNGYTDDDGLARTFGPEKSCTREAVVTFLWRLAGKPEPKSMKSPFKDVQNSKKYYYKAVLWAAEQGITGGYSDGTFRPGDTCLREHVVTFLWRYAGKPKVSTKNTFTDVKKSDYYYKAVLWAAKNNITKGYADDNYKTFRPKLECLREHVVTFLYRYAKLK